ncbi:MAG: F0F1 ATP synthase subunit epsilon [Proteobacteria bacterium]|nr:F0F1 ATP synthase subunit epsilon [Pseudomonadota bacterium]MDA1059379.1 F0F1 ATP synthase subunit epsilon [Pseudomonadota bacterium]
MADKIAFELVSPDRLLVSQDVDMVVIPGTEGDFGVLVGHQPMISTVRPGILEVQNAGAEPRRIFVNGGFAEVTGDRCAVMTEEAIPVADLKRADLEQRIRDAEEDIQNARSDLERHLVDLRLGTLREMLQVAA